MAPKPDVRAGAKATRQALVALTPQLVGSRTQWGPVISSLASCLWRSLREDEQVALLDGRRPAQWTEKAIEEFLALPPAEWPGWLRGGIEAVEVASGSSDEVKYVAAKPNTRLLGHLRTRASDIYQSKNHGKFQKEAEKQKAKFKYNFQGLEYFEACKKSWPMRLGRRRRQRRRQSSLQRPGKARGE